MNPSGNHLLNFDGQRRMGKGQRNNQAETRHSHQKKRNYPIARVGEFDIESVSKNSGIDKSSIHLEVSNLQFHQVLFLELNLKRDLELDLELDREVGLEFDLSLDLAHLRTTPPTRAFQS